MLELELMKFLPILLRSIISRQVDNFTGEYLWLSHVSIHLRPKITMHKRESERGLTMDLVCSGLDATGGGN